MEQSWSDDGTRLLRTPRRGVRARARRRVLAPACPHGDDPDLRSRRAAHAAGRRRFRADSRGRRVAAAGAAAAARASCAGFRSKAIRSGSTIPSSTSTITCATRRCPSPGNARPALQHRGPHRRVAARPLASALGVLGARGTRGRALRARSSRSTRPSTDSRAPISCARSCRPCRSGRGRAGAAVGAARTCPARALLPGSGA